jgi:hypothetical protein
MNGNDGDIPEPKDNYTFRRDFTVAQMRHAAWRDNRH